MTELRPTFDGLKFGESPTDRIGFYGAPPVVQAASASQAAIPTTPPTNVSPYGFSETQAAGIITLANELRASLVAIGLMKGAA